MGELTVKIESVVLITAIVGSLSGALVLLAALIYVCMEQGCQ